MVTKWLLIKKELLLTPKSPGIYKMINHKSDVLYVGKAKNLLNRLKSYVSEKNHIIRTERMLSQTHKIEITTFAIIFHETERRSPSATADWLLTRPGRVYLIFGRRQFWEGGRQGRGKIWAQQ